MQKISPAALPVCRSKSLLRWVMSTTGKRCNIWSLAMHQTLPMKCRQAISFWKLPDRKAQLLTEKSQHLQQNINEYLCMMCMRSPAAASHHAAQVCGRGDPTSPKTPVLQIWRPSEAHHSFLYTCISFCRKERLRLKWRANLRNISLYTSIWALSYAKNNWHQQICKSFIGSQVN